MQAMLSLGLTAAYMAKPPVLPSPEGRAAVNITPVSTLPIPDRETKRGGQSVYNFDALDEVGKWIGISGRDVKSVASAVSNYNKQFKVNVTDDGGKIILNSNGNPRTTYSRHLQTIAVDDGIRAALRDTPFENATVIVKRDT